MPYYPPIPFGLDANAADFKADNAVPAAGGIGSAADAGHIHPGVFRLSGQIQATGPLPKSIAFTKFRADTNLLVMIGATAIKLNAIGIAQLKVSVTGAADATFWTYSNTFAANNHLALPAFVHDYAGLAQGTVTVTLAVNDVNTGSDGNDDYFVTVYEYLAN